MTREMSGSDVICLDDREHGLRELIAAPVSHLPVGDIWIGLVDERPAPNGIIIERKSVADLEASILDGRYREQRSRIMAYATECKSNVAYIIEGDLSKTRSLGKQALQKHLTRLSLRYHISVFHTGSVKETAELCMILADQWKSDPTTFEQPATMTYVETRGNTRQGNTDDPHVFAVNVLQACRGISTAGAEGLLKAFGSLTGVWNASETAITAVQVGKQKLGPVKAKRLHTLLHGVSNSP